jgi:2-oxoglutarate ferredoxin oxidoreductase subunit delta
MATMVTTSMKRVNISEDRCKGCGLCTGVCPVKILVLFDKININGYHPVVCIEDEKCIGCTNCATMCPDSVFEIYKVAQRMF